MQADATLSYEVNKRGMTKYKQQKYGICHQILFKCKLHINKFHLSLITPLMLLIAYIVTPLSKWVEYKFIVIESYLRLHLTYNYLENLM